MSRITELEKQYPELNISILDMLKKMDPTKSYKYLPLLCKIFSKRFRHGMSRFELNETLISHQKDLTTKGINHENLSLKELISMSTICQIIPDDNFTVFKDFLELAEKNLLVNNDITSYKDLEEMREAISLASLRDLEKVLENEVYKEHEDETWVCVRPLTFSSSKKYGSATKWCTTYEKEKEYFERYWRQGILVYFINKKTGYKFAGYKQLFDDKDLSFWNAKDSRVDFLELEIDDYLYPIIRRIFKSDMTNKNLCSAETQELVHQECIPSTKSLFPLNEILRVDESNFFSTATVEGIALNLEVENTTTRA